MEQYKGNTLISKQRKIGYISALVLAPIFFVFAYFNQPERGLMAMSLSGVFLAILYVKRDIAGKPYFIATISILFFIQLALILLVDIPKKHFPGIIVMPFAIVDLFLILAIILVVGKLVDHSESGREP